MPLMAPTDYVRNTVLWLPLTVLLLVLAVFFVSVAPVSKPRQTHGAPLPMGLVVVCLAATTSFAAVDYLFDVSGLG